MCAIRFYYLAMGIEGRLLVVQRLEPLGLRNTLIATRNGDAYTISRLRRVSPTIDLISLGDFSSHDVPSIGRVGIPDPEAAFPWQKSMAFYGKWFEQIAESKLQQQLYLNVSRIRHQKMLEQIRRDNQFAVVGSYYSVFRAIMETKARVPLVLIDGSGLSQNSFPVILPLLADATFEQLLRDVLKRMLRHYPVVAPSGELVSAYTHGIEVHET